MLDRQKAWQQQLRERHEREGTLYDAVAVVEDVIIGRLVTTTCVACEMLQRHSSTFICMQLVSFRTLFSTYFVNTTPLSHNLIQYHTLIVDQSTPFSPNRYLFV